MESKGGERGGGGDPTKLELLYKSFKVKKEDFKEQQKESILGKYGGQEHLDAPSSELLLGQTEDYVEYSRQGTIIKGQEQAVACSKYEEDVKINNHLQIWGSYWKDGRWGYKCCHSFVKFSYCTGEAGKEIAPADECILDAAEGEEKTNSGKTQMELQQDIQKKEKKKKKHRKKNSDSQGRENKKHERLKKALNADEAHLLRVKETMWLYERKRPSTNSMYETQDLTEEEMEVYRKKRQRTDDPMASFLGQH